MLRVTTLYASSAAATAAYYAQYLTAAPGELPGAWWGRQAVAFGLSGTVEVAALELLLSGRHPDSGTPLGRELLDRYTADGRFVRAVTGFDATFSAPKSVSVWWALTGDHRLLEAHEIAVTAALEHLERFGSTTRIRCNGGRLHPDTNGLTIATFRQTTSRADDPQIHTHAVISAKVQTAEGRWLALDARYLKRHQRMLGGLYQSVLRAELTRRFGVEWGPLLTGQAEIAGVPDELLDVFCKRSTAISGAMAAKLDDFRQREGREPSRFERAALEREASADTRSRKSGHGAIDLATRWRAEASEVGWTVERLEDAIGQAARVPRPVDMLTVAGVVEAVAAMRSSWGRADVVQAICDRQRPVSQLSGHRWAGAIERAADLVVDHCVDLDPAEPADRRLSDGRSVWIEPTAPRFTSEAVLAEEEFIVSWAMDAQADPPAPSRTVDRSGLDVLQAHAAATVAGEERLVLVTGPAGAGKTRTLTAAVDDLHRHGRHVFGVAPTAKAARTLERETGLRSDTVAKLLHEWHGAARPPLPEFQLGAGATVLVDEAGMLTTPALHQLVSLADAHHWRLVLVGDHRQLQGVGRGGLLAELCRNGRVVELERVHRFTHGWEAAASLLLRAGDPHAFDAYEAHGRIIAGTLDTHLERMTAAWLNSQRSESIALVASSNDHVDTINQAVQAARLASGELNGVGMVSLAGGELAYVGDHVATRRNDRRLLTSTGQPVRNRDIWTVTGISADGSLSVSHQGGHGHVTLPADYVSEHVRLGYAATEHGHQSDTVTTAIALVSSTTTSRGLYVAATRGRDSNEICVITESDDIAEARDVLEGIVALDRADIPAITQRRTLAHQHRAHELAPAPPVTSRCVIPDWFEPLVATIRRELDKAERRVADNAAERAHRQAVLDVAEHRYQQVTHQTQPARDALAGARRAAEQARLDLDTAQRRLDVSGLRGRRHARQEHAVAERRLGRAEDSLEQAERRTAPAVEAYVLARNDVEHSRTDLHHHDLARQLDRYVEDPSTVRERVTALHTWEHWANGDTMTVPALAAAVTTLTKPNADNRLHALGNAMLARVGAADLWHQPPRLQSSTLEHKGLEVGL